MRRDPRIGWKKMEMRHWVFVLGRDDYFYQVGVAPREKVAERIAKMNSLGHWSVLCLIPARAKDESIYLQADIHDRIKANGFGCDEVGANPKYKLPAEALGQKALL